MEKLNPTVPRLYGPPGDTLECQGETFGCADDKRIGNEDEEEKGDGEREMGVACHEYLHEDAAARAVRCGDEGAKWRRAREGGCLY